MSLEERLRARILRDGPITFYEWMKAALYDEHEGYYCRADATPQGRAGDYRTAPETSPLFAATFAHYFAKLYADLKSPASFTVIESGAGNGVFAEALLRNLRTAAPEVFAVTHYVIDECSEAARAKASERLAEFGSQVSFQRLDEMTDPVNAGIVFSNELIDAFPVERVVMRDGRLRQMYVGLNEDEFVWIEGDLKESVAEYSARAGLSALREGQIAEINLEAEEFIARASGLLKTGYVITVDYGAERDDSLNPFERLHGTLRAFRRHQLSENVLARPGQQDLTTTIDWTQIIQAGERVGLSAIRHQALNEFLISEGLLVHLAEVTSATDSGDAARLTASARELILPTGLAAHFQVLVQEKKA